MNKEISQYQKTIQIQFDGPKITSAPSDYEKTILLPSEERTDSDDTFIDNYALTEIEKQYFLESVKKHGRKKYKYQGKLVTGGMGAIIKVFDRDLQRVSAMKVIRPDFKSDRESLTRFITEAKITGLLEHPNIIPVHELGLLRELGLYFTMKLAQGEPLNRILHELEQENPLYHQKYHFYALLNIFRKICDAVSFAHSRNIIHQDIKPENIIIGEFGEVLVMDWGLATYIGDPENEPDPGRKEILKEIICYTCQDKNVIKGSPAYMAPEQIIADPDLIDERTDIFLLGGTLYHIFTLTPPYQGKNIYEVLYNAEHWKLIPPQNRDPSRQIPEEICRIIMKAMAYERKDRYQNVKDLINDIDDVISGKWSQKVKHHFSTGDFLMKEGETGEEAYLITRGIVQVSKNIHGRKIVLGTLKQGDIVGEMALITHEKRSATVEAIEDTEVAVLTKDILIQNLNKLPPYIEKIISTITRRLQSSNSLIHPYLTVDSTHIVLQQLSLILRAEHNHKMNQFQVPYSEMINRISEDLGLPKEKIIDGLIKAEELELLKIQCGQDTLDIPDLAEIINFTYITKSIAKIKSDPVFG